MRGPAQSIAWRSMVILPLIRHVLREGEAIPTRLRIEPDPDAAGEPMGRVTRA